MKKLLYSTTLQEASINKILVLGLVLMMVIHVVQAHVGSPGVVYEGKAGPYHILVNVNPPDVIPGTAQVSVYVQEGGVNKVQVQPIYWYAGDEGSPSPDEATPVDGMPGQYEGLIWLMWSGTASLSVTVEGDLGSGTTLIPVMAASTAQREMEPQLGWLLVGLGLVLVILMITTIGASVSDGLQKPGENATIHIKRKRWIGMAVTAVLLALVLYGGSAWWNSWAKDYQQYMYKPFQANSTIRKAENGQVLTFSIDTSYLHYKNSKTSYFIPDHGKIMHMFLIKEGSLDVFAHVHPVRVDTLTFEVKLPEMPKGRYFVYADVVSYNGFAETIADTIEMPGPALPVQLTSTDNTFTPSDPDDTYIISNPYGGITPVLTANEIVICGQPGIRTRLPDGSSAIWEYQEGKPLVAGQLYPLTFNILDPEGKPAALEPYMGMMGHAVIFKTDGSVYVHLHPVGNYSIASQDVLQERITESQKLPSVPEPKMFADSINQEIIRIAAMKEEDRNKFLMKGMNHAASKDGQHGEHSIVTFPYVFPEPGNYRIWVQMKRKGKVLNSAFDAVVIE